MELPNRDQLTVLAGELNNPEIIHWNNFTIYWEYFKQTESDWNTYNQIYLFIKQLSKLINKVHYEKIFDCGIITHKTSFSKKICISYSLYDKNKNKYEYCIVPTDNNLYKILLVGSLDTIDLVIRKLLTLAPKTVDQIYHEYIKLLSDCEDV